MNAVLHHHKGILLQNRREMCYMFNSLFWTLLPIEKRSRNQHQKILKVQPRNHREENYVNLHTKLH